MALVSVKIVPADFLKKRFGFVVSKAVSKKATARNLIKRRARTIISKNLKSIKSDPKALFIFSKGSEKLSFQELERQILSVVKKSKLAL